MCANIHTSIIYKYVFVYECFRYQRMNINCLFQRLGI